MSYTEKVVDPRAGKGSALMFFNVQIGSTDENGEFTPYRVIKNCILRSGGRHSLGVWVQFPQETRKRKNPETGVYEAVMEASKSDPEKFYEKRDNLVENYATRSGTGENAKLDTPKYVWKNNDAMTEQAHAVYSALGKSESGRGAVPQGAPTKVTAARAFV